MPRNRASKPVAQSKPPEPTSEVRELIERAERLIQAGKFGTADHLLFQLRRLDSKAAERLKRRINARV